MVLFSNVGSAPCRSVMMAAEAVGVTLNKKMTNLMAGEHMTPEFLKVSSLSFSYYTQQIEFLKHSRNLCKK